MGLCSTIRKKPTSQERKTRLALHTLHRSCEESLVSHLCLQVLNPLGQAEMLYFEPAKLSTQIKQMPTNQPPQEMFTSITALHGHAVCLQK